MNPPDASNKVKRVSGAASNMPDGSEPLRTRQVFHAVIQVMLDDGELTREEQRLAIKLGTLLFKQEEELRDLALKSPVEPEEALESVASK
jgi:hypothetical protein